MVLLAVACSVPATRSAEGGTGLLNQPVNAYVVRRSWHSDVGFAVEALLPALAPLRRDFPGTRFILFGFGDRRYLLAHNKASASLPALFWP